MSLKSPARLPQGEMALKGKAFTQARPGSRRRPRILLASPAAASRAEAREILERLGWIVEEAPDGASALLRAAAHPPDLVLLDASLLSSGDVALAPALRRRTASAMAPLLVTVPAGDATAIGRAVASGAADVIPWPVHPPLLQARVQAALENLQRRSALEHFERQLESIQRLARIAIWQHAIGSGSFQVSDGVGHLLGLLPKGGRLSVERVLGCFHPDDRATFLGLLRKSAEHGTTFSVDTRVHLPDETERVIHWQGERSKGSHPDPRPMEGTLQDVTEHKRAEEQVRFLAFHDGLTGLTNRAAFIEILQRAVHLARRHGRSGALLFLDLDNFKRVNDTFGHAAGDRLLQGVAHRLERCVRQSDLILRSGTEGGRRVARLGGDEFTVLLTEVSRRDDAAAIARRVIDALREPFLVEHNEIVIGASIGVTVYPADGEDTVTLLRNADTAMYQAKERGRNNYQFFTASLNEAASRRVALERKLCRAFESHELNVYYQPQVHIDTGRLTGAEALLRWHDSEFGAVSPDEFVPLAEDAGLIKPIGEWVLRAACWQAKAWSEAGLPPLRIAVNVSPHHFRDDDFVAAITQALWDTGVPAQQLELEITENVFIHNRDTAVSILRQLKEIGVSIALDDFGTGYSSLSYLKQFPVDTVKIDRSFVRDIAIDPDDAAIAAAIVSMAHALHLRAVAEGVETEQQRDFLRARGCQEMQGYLISPPVSPEAIAEMLGAS